MKILTEDQFTKAFKAGKATVITGPVKLQPAEKKDTSIMDAAKEVSKALMALNPQPGPPPQVTVQAPEVRVAMPAITKWEFVVHRNADGLISRISAKAMTTGNGT